MTPVPSISSDTDLRPAVDAREVPERLELWPLLVSLVRVRCRSTRSADESLSVGEALLTGEVLTEP